MPDYQGMYRLFKCREIQPKNHLYDQGDSCKAFINNGEDKYILVGCFEIKKDIDYQGMSLTFAYQGIIENNDNQIPFQQYLVKTIEAGEKYRISDNYGELIDLRRTFDLELEDEAYLWPGKVVEELLNVHMEFDYLNRRYMAVNQDNDIVFIMKKWSSSYKGDSEYFGNAIPLYSGTELYIKKSYVGILEQKLGSSLMMKTSVETYKQSY